MTAKVIYFIDGLKPTEDDLAAIATLNLAAEKPYEVVVRNKQQPMQSGGAIEYTDYVAGEAGNIPVDYQFHTVLDPENLPTTLPSNKVVVSDNQAGNALDLGNNQIATGTHAVFSNTYFGFRVIHTSAVVANGQTLTIGGVEYTFTVTGNTITAIVANTP